MSVDSMANGWAKALSIDRKQVNMFFEKMMDGFAYHKIILDKAGKPVDYVFLEVNTAFERMTGLNKEKIIGKKATEVLQGIENDPADWIGVYGRVALTCVSVEFENFAEPLGKWYKISAYCPEKGYFVTLFKDITESRKAAEEIARLASFPELNPNAIMEVDFDCKVHYANSAAKATFPDALDSPHHPLFADWKQVIDTLQSKERPLFSRELRIGESTFYQTFYLVPNAQLVRFYMVNIDELKRAENALRESEHRWATTVKSIVDAVITTDLGGNVTFLNHVAEDLTGWNSTEALRKPLSEIFNIINEQTRSKVDNPVTRVLKEGKVVGLANHTILMRKDGTPVPIDDSGAPIKDKDGNVTGVVLVFRDITERKKAEEVIAQQAFMIANANDAIIGYSFDQKVTFWNKAAEQLYGYKAEEALGQGGADLLKPSYVNVSREELIHRLMTSGHMEAESVRQTKDGRKLDAEVHVILLRDEMGKPIGYVSVDRDITERKKAERELWQAKNDWERTFDSVPDFIAILDNQHRIVRANRAMAKQLGVTPEQAIGLSCYTCVHGTSLPPEFCPHSKTVQDGKEHVAEVHEPRLGGDFLVSTTPLKDEKGRMIGSVHVARDITERKKAEEALKRMNEELEERIRKRTAEVSAERQRLYNVLETLPAYVVLLDKDYCVPFANKVFRERFGESHGRKCYDFLFSRKEPCENCETYKVLKTNSPHRWEWTGPDRRDYDIYDFPFVEADGSTLILEMGIDITERKRAEQKLKAASLYSRSLIEASLDPLVTINAEGKITDINKATEEATGCPREQMIDSDFSDYFTEPDKARAGYQQVFTEGVVRDYPIAIRHTTGKVTDVLYNATLFKNETGDVQGVFAAARDVTERKRAEKELNKYQEHLEEMVKERTAELQESEQRFAKAFHSSPAAMTISRLPDGMWVDVNESFLRLSEYSRKEIVGHNFTELNLFDGKQSELAELINTIRRQGSISNIELRARTKSGKHLRLLFSGVLVNLNGQDHIISSQIDITDRATLQEKLEESAIRLEKYANQMEQLARERLEKLKDAERLAAIGQTAGMVGHDIRNPLQSILSELYLAKTELPGITKKDIRNSLTESIANIENDINYINKIVQDLQDFAKPIKPTAKETNLETICKEVLSKTNIPQNIKVSFQVDEDVTQLIADPDLLKRIMANLITNAVQAMPEGGKLDIRAHQEKDNTIITVKDTGVGIPEDVKPKLFTPLFTTKSKGQGFGLAVVKRMTEALGGNVSFESEVGKGTKFIVTLPRLKN